MLGTGSAEVYTPLLNRPHRKVGVGVGRPRSLSRSGAGGKRSAPALFGQWCGKAGGEAAVGQFVAVQALVSSFVGVLVMHNLGLRKYCQNGEHLHFSRGGVSTVTA